LLMRTSYKMSDSLARATGAVYRRAWRQSVYAGCVLGGAWIGHFWGVAGVAAGVLGAVTINFLLMAELSLKETGAGWGRFLAAHRHAAQTAVCAALIAYPLAGLLRKLECGAFLTLAATSTALALFGVFAVRYAPGFFLGQDGLSLLELLRERLPAGLSAIFPHRPKLSSKNYGVKDASIENA
jgi:hypothetical protein